MAIWANADRAKSELNWVASRDLETCLAMHGAGRTPQKGDPNRQESEHETRIDLCRCVPQCRRLQPTSPELNNSDTQPKSQSWSIMATCM